jgi:predicted MPP superfamily phosphohydrolase
LLTRRGFFKLILSGVAAVAALGGYSVGVEAMGRPRIAKYALHPPNWTRGLKLKIVALADFHACDPWMTAERIKSICEQANSLEPDIILLLGDYATGMKHAGAIVDPAKWGSALSVLKAPLGVHAILGNHDYWDDMDFQLDPDRQTFSEVALRDAGISVYINDVARVEKDGHSFWLAGLGDQLALRSRGLDDLRGTMTQITDMSPVILMAHEPDIFPEVSERVSLTLSGHMHGGQINILGWAPVVPSRYGSRYIGGHIEENGSHIIVSRGLGCTGVPVRLGAWPEIVEIDLA